MAALDDALAATVADVPQADLVERFRYVRSRSLALASPLSPEDQTAQSMPDASPCKWHLAHTTWFFETFILEPHAPGYRLFDPRYGYLFNSYYEAMGARHPRPARGLLTRPSITDIGRYRAHVDKAMEVLLAGSPSAQARDLTVLGLAHEEQHQELILMDILNLFAQSPLRPAYTSLRPAAIASPAPPGWIEVEGGVVEIGASGPDFVFDNETPAHPVLIGPYRIASHLVTNGQWLRFMEDGGYRRPEFWLSDGWARVQAEGWNAPLYWQDVGDDWRVMTLYGSVELDADAPVTHVSFYEAAAYSAWSGMRLPTEAEWEHAAKSEGARLHQLDTDAWQWTASAYSPHPGFAPAAGAVGEYNAKFMVGQMVLKGGACITPTGHSRPSYRNFYYPHQRWMFAGVRLASDALARGPGDSFRDDVIAGLSAPRKSLPPKWFYDAAGSALFEEITRLPEYYLTRQETALLDSIVVEIGQRIPPGATLVEFGSGASVKTRHLLDAAPQVGVYMPVDVSRSAILEASAAVRADYPDLEVRPLIGDFTKLTELEIGDSPPVGFFPGSTIGNFAPDEAVDLLTRARRLLGSDGLFIVGVDVAKDEQTLLAAYNDATGVTAAFNLNLLARINRELDGRFELANFVHRAVWNAMETRIEMHLQARVSHTASAAGREFTFVEGETIHTENSYKYPTDFFEGLARRGGWRVARRWVSPPPSFAVYLLSPA